MTNKKQAPEDLRRQFEPVGLQFCLLFGALLLFAVVFLYHWFKVWVFAVDIPFWDEWYMLEPDTAGHWLWRVDGEHRIITTKLIINLLWKLNGWDFAAHQTMNFALFGILLVTLGWTISRSVPKVPAALTVLLLTFVLSPRASEIHHWALTGHYHWALLFLFLCATLLFPRGDERQADAAIGLGAVSGVLAIYSFGIALPGVLMIMLGYSGVKLSRVRKGTGQRGLEIRQWVAGALPLLIGLACYPIGYNSGAEAHGALTMPVTALYWNHFVTLFSNGFGFKSPLWLCYLIVASLLVSSGAAWYFIWRLRRVEYFPWALAVMTVTILVAMAATTAGRAAGGIDQAVAGRYTEVTMMLIPLLGAALWVGFEQRRVARAVIAGAYTLICAAGFFLSWPMFDDYELTYQIRRIEARNLTACYIRRKPCKVVNLYPKPIQPETLDWAASQHMSFMKKIVTQQWFMNN